MKKILLLALLLPLSAALVESCSGSDKEAERQRQYEDSVRRSDSIAAVERAAIEQALIDSIRQDSIAKAELQAQESQKIETILKKYSTAVAEVRKTCYFDGEFYDAPLRTEGVWEKHVAPAIEINKQLKAMEGSMTPEQKTQFQKLSKQINELLD